MYEKGYVYCMDCKYLMPHPTEEYKCGHPENKGIRSWDNESWLRPKMIKRHPSEINKDNDCKWYEKENLNGKTRN